MGWIQAWGTGGSRILGEPGSQIGVEAGGVGEEGVWGQGCGVVRSPRFVNAEARSV